MLSHELTSQINWPPAGKYIVAVSGGVDSLCLLDMLAKSDRDYDLIVAHFDHGMRDDSRSDAEFVRMQADHYDLDFQTERAELAGKGESEARTARYEFLERIMGESGAAAIITAHHADDRLETSLINALRGTGAAGLVALGDEPTRRRPLLGVTKADLMGYAKDHSLQWREDSTNESTDYTRNLIRQEVIPGHDWEVYRQQQVALGSTLEQYRAELATWSKERLVTTKDDELIVPSRALQQLTLDELSLAFAEWLRLTFGQNPLPAGNLQRLALFAKSARRGNVMPLTKVLMAEMQAEGVVIRRLFE